MKALVTGCSGFIVSHLVKRLLEQGSGGNRNRRLYRLLLKGWLIAVLEWNTIEIFWILGMVDHGQ